MDESQKQQIIIELKQMRRRYSMLLYYKRHTAQWLTVFSKPIDGYNMFRVDKKSCKGGGLIMHIHDKLKSSYCTDMMNIGFNESLWCVVEAEEGKFMIGLCYRST